MLKSGDRRRALAVCEQIVVIAPDREFDDAFWANAAK